MTAVESLLASWREKANNATEGPWKPLEDANGALGVEDVRDPSFWVVEPPLTANDAEHIAAVAQRGLFDAGLLS